MRSKNNFNDFRNLIESGEKNFRLEIDNEIIDDLKCKSLDLSFSKFSNCKFSKISFEKCNFRGVIFDCCSFEEVFIDVCFFNDGRFIKSIIKRSTFKYSILPSFFENTTITESFFGRLDFSTILIGTEIKKSYFASVKFNSLNIVSSTMTECNLVEVSIINTNISFFYKSNLKSIKDIGWKSIALSIKEPNLHEFLINNGVPDLVSVYLIDAVKATDPEMLFKIMQNVFISYGGPDTDFARKLKEDLQNNGVESWFFPDDAEFGQKLHKVMHDNVNKFDRVLLLCSKKSLTRPGVLNEIEQALSREAREGGTSIIIPLALDDYVYDQDFKSTRAGREIHDRVIAKFTPEDDYKIALKRLLSALRKK